MANHRKKRPAKQANPGHWMCKPWKHGYEKKLRPSERRRIQEKVSRNG